MATTAKELAAKMESQQATLESLAAGVAALLAANGGPVAEVAETPPATSVAEVAANADSTKSGSVYMKPSTRKTLLADARGKGKPTLALQVVNTETGEVLSESSCKVAESKSGNVQLVFDAAELVTTVGGHSYLAGSPGPLYLQFRQRLA